MTSRIEKRNEANASASVSRNYGMIVPNRRVLEGHTRPCEDCGSVDWLMDLSRGEIVCNSCGLVVEENVIDPGAEWTNRDNSQIVLGLDNPLHSLLLTKDSIRQLMSKTLILVLLLDMV